MSQISDSDLSRMRNRPHRVIPYLAIYDPNTVFAAQIDMSSISKGEREIDISTISGDPNSVVNGMTCYIGTTPSGRDKGRLRVRQATSSQITVAENAEDWIDGWYLTVVQYFEPWAVFPRIVLDDNNVPIFYKDFDIPYSDQNDNMDPVVNMGPHDAGLLTTGAYSVFYTASGTFDPTDGSIPTGYQWTFEGATVTGSGERDPGYIHYTGAGNFMTTLEVTADTGKTFKGYRHIMVRDRPDAGPTRPITRWGIRSFDGSRDEGGYTLSVFLRERTDFAKAKDGALAVVFTETWHGGKRVSVGGNAENRNDILFVGYIDDESIFLNPTNHFLEFRLRSVTGIMENLSTYSATLESKEDAVTWNEMRDMTVDKAAIHFLRWHSNVLQLADIARAGDTKRVQFIDFARGNLKEAISEIYESTIGAQVVADRQGKIWAEKDASLIPTGSRSFVDALILTDQDWRNEIAIERRDKDELAYLEMGGIAYSGPTTGSFDPYLAGAPGDVAGYWGSVERTQGLVVAGQSQLNEFVGLAYARANPEYSEVIVPVAGDYRNIDLAPQERVRIVLESDDTYRGIVWDEKPFFPSEVSYEIYPESQTALMSLTLREETEGEPGESIEIPEDPPWDSGDLPDFDIEFPPLIPLPPLPPPIEGPPGDGATVYAVFTSYLGRTSNFWDVSPNWEEISIPSIGIRGFWLDPQDPINTGYLLVSSSTLYKTTNLSSTSPTWTSIIASSDAGSFGYGSLAIYDVTLAEQTPNYIGLALRIGPDPGGGRLAYGFSFDGGASWTITDRSESSGLPAGQGGAENQVMASKHDSGVVYYMANDGGQGRLSRSLDWGVGWQFVFSDSDTRWLLEIPFPSNPADERLFINYEKVSGDFNFYDSSDHGLSFINRSPFWDGVQWWPVVGSQNRVSTMENSFVHPKDGAIYALFQKDSGNEMRFAVRLGSGGWDLRRVWNPSANFGPLYYNPTNQLKWHLLGTDADGMIWGSEDGGYTWNIKNGDWESQIDDFSSVGFKVTIRPVWTI